MIGLGNMLKFVYEKHTSKIQGVDPMYFVYVKDMRRKEIIHFHPIGVVTKRGEKDWDYRHLEGTPKPSLDEIGLSPRDRLWDVMAITGQDRWEHTREGAILEYYLREYHRQKNFETV